MSTYEPGWLPDPTGRHQFRWWDGGHWSDVVADHGVEQHDPIAPYQPHAQPSVVQPPVASGPPGGGPPARPDGGGRWTAGNGALALVAVLAVAAVAAAVVVVLNRGDGGSDPDVTGPPPREALTELADLPAGWAESEVTYARSANQVCEPRLDPPSSGRETEVAFERANPSGAINHRILEYTPEFAADYLDEAERQASECGTFEDEQLADGQTHTYTARSELLTGPTFGDETVWYVLHVEWTSPGPSTNDVVICLDRHDGVISSFTISTQAPLSGDDRALLEELARSAAEQLEGGGEA